MTTRAEAYKGEILTVIDKLPDEELPRILDIVKKIHTELEKDRYQKFFKQILEEDAELFRRLAE